MCRLFLSMGEVFDNYCAMFSKMLTLFTIRERCSKQVEQYRLFTSVYGKDSKTLLLSHMWKVFQKLFLEFRLNYN